MFVLGGAHVATIATIAVHMAVLAAALTWRFRRGAWRQIDLTGEDPLRAAQ